MTETMTPAQELRAAAEKIQEFAGAATPGPWIAYTDEVATDWHPDSVNYQNSNGDLDVASRTGPDNAEHIALWHPGVAQIIGDWLEAEAHGVEASLAAFPDTDAENLVRWPLRIARAINGEVAA